MIKHSNIGSGDTASVQTQLNSASWITGNPTMPRKIGETRLTQCRYCTRAIGKPETLCTKCATFTTVVR